MKKNILKVSAISIAASAILVGCGSTSSSDLVDYSTGYFIDAAVQNAHYETTSGFSGDTDEFGKFKYKVGDKVKFSLGKLVLGETHPGTDGKITPKTLIADSLTPNANESATITLMLQMLQSLDSDNNTSNGITIDPAIITDLEKLSTEHHINDLNETSLLALSMTLDNELDEDYDGHLDVNETEATEHFEQSIQEFENGHIPDENTRQYGKGFGGGHGKPDNAGSQDEHNESEESSHNDFNLSEYPLTSNLSDELKNSLAYMGNEERLAYDTYNYLYNYQLTTNNIEIKQFTNIANKSEIKHIGIIKDLVARYNINGADLNITDVNSSTLTMDSNITTVAGIYDIQKIQDLYNTLISLGETSNEASLKVGCMVEVTDVNDLDEYIIQAEDSNATDVVAAFNVLRDGSYKHYWAFDKGLKNLGITNGCYYNGDNLLTNKDGVYPQD